MSVMTEVSWGELIDKYTILAIKSERLNDAAKLQNVRTEMAALAPARQKAYDIADISSLEAELKAVNETLWVIEDDIRDCERAKDFGPTFIELARAVYHRNDERAAFKRQINDRLGSRLVEEKSYRAY
ncbi:MAG: hypothetical protein HYZ13_08165 [Acidobacteria bacterium]|nr:hypothetical protein [Acidobacteriota bacterium]